MSGTEKTDNSRPDSQLREMQVSCESVSFLSHVEDHSGIRPDPSKIKTIVKFKQPVKVANV